MITLAPLARPDRRRLQSGVNMSSSEAVEQSSHLDERKNDDEEAREQQEKEKVDDDDDGEEEVPICFPRRQRFLSLSVPRKRHSFYFIRSLTAKLK